MSNYDWAASWPELLMVLLCERTCCSVRLGSSLSCQRGGGGTCRLTAHFHRPLDRSPPLPPPLLPPPRETQPPQILQLPPMGHILPAELHATFQSSGWRTGREKERKNESRKVVTSGSRRWRPFRVELCQDGCWTWTPACIINVGHLQENKAAFTQRLTCLN